METTTPDWSSLPDHLLAFIAKRLPTSIDTLRFRAVCGSFRSSIPPPQKTLSPHKGLKLSMPSLPGRRGHLVLAEFTYYEIKPLPSSSNPHQNTNTWLVKCEELNSGKVRFEDPLSRHRLGNLSNKVPESEKLPRYLNLLDYQIKEVAKAYRVEQVYQGKGINRRKPIVFNKAAVSSSFDKIDDGFAIMTIIQGMALVWRNVDKKWTKLDIGFDYFLDIIYHNEKFYALMSSGVAVTVESKSLTVSQVSVPLQIDRFWDWSYLVKSSQGLFLIIKRWQWRVKPIEFKVYKLDEQKCGWVQVMDGLEDSVFFVGDDCSFCLSAKRFPGCKGNSVYFKHGPFEVNDCHPGTDGGIFNLKDSTVGGLSDFPGYSKIFCPRPSWVD
ncbi:F-box protein SKIP23-like [Mangifera indica]|uniref:F-box protein SKIP23-like n=1 Tax=Mangifera indica TaxID=29780 RepID=UPI001CFAD942|nr:F-box protein SKIP23-like [Mangifera indica]